MPNKVSFEAKLLEDLKHRAANALVLLLQNRGEEALDQLKVFHDHLRMNNKGWTFEL